MLLSGLAAGELRSRSSGGADLLRQPRILTHEGDGPTVEAPFAVYQTDQEGETRLFATGIYRDRLERAGGRLKIRDKLILLDTFAIPSLLATPL